jgi:hypothetical protein
MSVSIRGARSTDLELPVEGSARRAAETIGCEPDRGMLAAGVAAEFGDGAKGRYCAAGDGKEPIGQRLVTRERRAMDDAGYRVVEFDFPREGRHCG